MKSVTVLLTILLAFPPAFAGKCDSPEHGKLSAYLNLWTPIHERTAQTMWTNYEAQKVAARRGNLAAHVSYVGFGVAGISAMAAAILYGLPASVLTLTVGGTSPLIWVNGLPVYPAIIATFWSLVIYFTVAIEPDGDPKAFHSPIVPADKGSPHLIMQGIRLADHIGNEVLKNRLASLDRDQYDSTGNFLTRGRTDQIHNNLLLEEARLKYVVAKARADYHREQRENLRRYCLN